ncbi:MAG TPA: tetratricopeptide repeat protein, partial [Pyrinomonadaceae bacterium]|nr:tetratricopeptide repeat protein [Pyrinomonadaceae bacterium]
MAVRVRGADGTLLARADDLDKSTGEEQVVVLAESEGVYQLEIQAAEEAEAGSYLVRLVEVRAPTPQDRLIVTAERDLLDANRLLAERSAESRRLAIKKYEEAATLFRQAGDHGREAFAVAQIGMIQDWMGDSQAAQAYFNRALELQRESHNRAGEARALTGLGQLMSSAGEWQKALDYHHQALALRRAENDGVGVMVSLDRIGEIYVGLGEWRKALNYYNQALEVLSGTNSLRLRAKLLGDVGQVYEALGEREQALENYRQALALRRKRNNQGGAALMLHRIGLLQASSGQLQEALDRYEEALKIQQSLGNIKAAETLTSIGETYYRLGDPSKALSYLDSSSALRGLNTATPGEALTRYWVARVRRDQGDLTGALKEIEAAVSIVENLRSLIASHELRASYFATVEAYYEFYIDLLMQLQARDPSSSHQEAALGVSERSRARSLLEMLREERADIRRGVDPALLARERFLQRQLNAKAEEQSDLGASARAREQATQLAKELEMLTTQYMELEAQIRATSPHYAALTQPRPLGPKEIQQLLDPQTLLLEYKLGETRSYLWAVTTTSIESFELPKRAEVEASARRLYELLTERNRRVNGETPEQRQTRLQRADSEYAERAAELSRTLLGRVAPLLGDKRLLIVADGALCYIPFAALPEPETAASGNAMQKQEAASLVQRAGAEANGKAP